MQQQSGLFHFGAAPPPTPPLRLLLSTARRVGEADPDTEGWDELPDCFTRLTQLQVLTLGTAATYLLQAGKAGREGARSCC